MRKNIFLIFIFFSVAAFSQSTKKVVAEYTYYAPETMSIDEAKRIAIDRAKIQAIADEFGTSVSQSTSTVITTKNGETNSEFFAIGGSDVKGEWIETLAEPKYHISFQDNMIVVKCEVKGVVRERKNAAIELEAKLLRNRPSLRFESAEFRDGDNLFLYFMSPVDGYLAVYLVDENSDAFCILPYGSQKTGYYHVSANTQYILFSKENARSDDLSDVDEYVMTCDKDQIINRIYVIFSPNKFHKALDNKTSVTLPRMLSYKDFVAWLTKNRNMDIDLLIKALDITLKK